MSIKIFNYQGATYLVRKIKTLLNSKAEADHTHTVLMDYSYDTTTQSLVINQLVCEASQ